MFLYLIFRCDRHPSALTCLSEVTQKVVNLLPDRATNAKFSNHLM